MRDGATSECVVSERVVADAESERWCMQVNVFVGEGVVADTGECERLVLQVNVSVSEASCGSWESERWCCK